MFAKLHDYASLAITHISALLVIVFHHTLSVIVATCVTPLIVAEHVVAGVVRGFQHGVRVTVNRIGTDMGTVWGRVVADIKDIHSAL